MDFVCSFCEKPRKQVKKMVSGPRVFICNECIQKAIDALPNPQPPIAAGLRCSFDGQSAEETGRRLVLRSEIFGSPTLNQGETPGICKVCLTLCRDILNEEMEAEGAAPLIKDLQGALE